MKISTNPDAYGLDDPEILQEATQLAPELFSALLLAKRIGDRLPITSDTDIEALLGVAAEADGDFVFPGVHIRKLEARDRFPNEFLPVTDRRDLVRKAYLAITIEHQRREHSQREKIHTGKVRLTASHPLPERIR
jgi:hypothetical protein